jgi:hypothetical protein
VPVDDVGSYALFTDADLRALCSSTLVVLLEAPHGMDLRLEVTYGGVIIGDVTSRSDAPGSVSAGESCGDE